MTLESLSTWQTEWANLPKVADDSWKQNLAGYLSSRLNGRLEFQSYQPKPGHFSYSFNESAFISQLAGVDYANPIGISAIANGMAAAFNANSALVAPGSSIGAPGNPATTYSAVTGTVFDSAAVSAMQSRINSTDTTPVSDALNSDFPVKLREGVLLLTATITGTNSVTPTPGPLTDAARGVE